MKRSIAAFTICVAFPLATAQPALAHGLRGQLAGQSQAAIRISVSVAPVFDREIRFDHAGAAIVHLRSSLVGVRYAVVTDPEPRAGAPAVPDRSRRYDAPPGAVPRSTADERLLVLIVPD